MSHHQTTGHNHYINLANKSLENVAKFKYLGMTVTNQTASIKKLTAD
jgi:ERCC4-related helicase